MNNRIIIGFYIEHKNKIKDLRKFLSATLQMTNEAKNG